MKEESKKTTTKKTTTKKTTKKATTKTAATKTAAKKVATKATTKKSVEKKPTTKTTVKKAETKKENVNVEPKKEIKVKESKNEKVSSKKETLETMFDTSYKSMITIVIVTLLVIGLAIGLASIVKKGKNKTNIDTSNAVIQYDEILIGNLLEQSNNTYYVLVYNKDDKNLNTYNTYLSNYKTKDNALRVYYSVIENGFNKKYVSSEKNLFVSNIDEFKIMSTTLLKIDGKKVVEAYDEKDSIISQLKKINN